MMTINKKRPGYLVETCLLTFGLISLKNEELLANWDLPEATFCWLDKGEIILGSMAEYLPFRASAPQGKFSWSMLASAMAQKQSGAFTASATMEVCRRYGIPYAVSCGIGGIGEVKGKGMCMDLPALRDLPVTLIATSPKDMLDISATVAWLKQAGVTVLGDGQAFCDGFLFSSEKVPLTGIWQGEMNQPPLLILRSIATEHRLEDKSLLAQAVVQAKEVERQGGYYHPAVNATLDKLSQGYTSQLQFQSLLANAHFAARLARMTSKPEYS